MKFSNVLPVGLVLASALTATTALPVDHTLIAREPAVAYYARSFHELEAREPFSWGSIGKIFNAIKPLAKPFVKKIPHVGGFLSNFFKRDGGADDDDLAELFYARHLASTELVARTPEEAVDAFANALLADLQSDNSVVRRSLEELEAREPFTIPPGVIDAVVKNGPAIIKAATPFVKKAASTIKSWFSRLFRRDGLSDGDVSELLADLVSGVSRRAEDADAEAAWNDLVKAFNDSA